MYHRTLPVKVFLPKNRAKSPEGATAMEEQKAMAEQVVEATSETDTRVSSMDFRGVAQGERRPGSTWYSERASRVYVVLLRRQGNDHWPRFVS